MAEHYGIREGSYSLLYAPVDVWHFRPRTDSENERRRAAPIRIGTIANWNPGKGIIDFIRVAGLVRDRLGPTVEFILAGARLATQQDYAARVDAEIERLHLRPSVSELGFVSDVAEVMAKLDIVVLCSYAEAGPMVLMEAMASGLPVVAYDAGGVSELVHAAPQGPAGIVVKRGEVERLTQALFSLVTDAALRSTLGAAGRESAERIFALDRAVERHRLLYRSLLFAEEA